MWWILVQFVFVLRFDISTSTVHLKNSSGGPNKVLLPHSGSSLAPSNICVRMKCIYQIYFTTIVVQTIPNQ